jgi:vWA domain found in the FtsH ternary systems/N-terminal helical region fused to the FtsH ternary system vWA domain
MGDERLDGAQAEAFLSGAFALARDAAVTPTWFEMAVRSLEAAYTERPLIPAPTLAFDLAALLHGERLLPIATPAVEGLRDALRGYEDHVLARLTAERRWTRLTEALTAAPKELHAAAIGMTVSQVLQRLKLNVGTGVSTGVVRRFASKPIEDVLDAGRAALWDPELSARLADGFHLMAKAARRTRDLLSDAEVFLIENIGALKGLGPRVALAQLAEVAQAVDEQLPTRLRGHAFEDGDAPTQLEEDSAFPVGGFSSIATVGSLENLVTSELIYMEQGDDPDLRPDLFDVRFVEGELLYYARDESVAVRRKRTLVLIFDPSLVRARVLDAKEQYQRLVWALGSVTALVRKLSEWLDTEALRFELVFVQQNAEVPLDEERNIARLLLREFEERGQLEFVEAETTLRAIRQARETHKQRARVMLFATKMPSGLEGDSAPDALIDAGGPRPLIHWLDSVNAEGDGPSEAVDAWAAATRQLLDGLMKKKKVSGAR